MKKVIWGIVAGSVVLVIGAFLLGRYALPNNALSALPKPELAEGQRGELGIDKNINESTIDMYLNRSDAVYRDVRMLVDPGNYAAIGGDANLSGFVKGFEVVPLPYIMNVTGLPEAVGKTYDGPTLFTVADDGKVTANYKESMAILEALFPRDKVIFLMCGGGGYSGMMKNLLVKLGWDESKIYDVGGYWYYEGENDVPVKRTLASGEVVYDFYKVPYHEIDFSKLTRADGEMSEMTVKGYEAMTKEKQSFVVFVDQTGCVTADKLRAYATAVAKENNVSLYRMMFSEVKESPLGEYVKYYPSVAVIANGEVVGYLKADSDEDSEKYNNEDAFRKWLEQYL